MWVLFSSCNTRTVYLYIFGVWWGQNRLKSDLKCTLKCGEQLPKGEPCLVPSAALVAWGWDIVPIAVLQGGLLLLASYSPRTVRPGATVTWGEILCTVCLSTFPSLNSGLHGPSLGAGVPQWRACHIPSILILFFHFYGSPAS